MYNNLLVAVSTLLMVIAYMDNNYIVMILARIVIGLNMGINTLAPMYVFDEQIQHEKQISLLQVFD